MAAAMGTEPPAKAATTRSGRKRTTNQLEWMRIKLMKSMWNHSQSWPFKEPVDHVKLNIPTYPEIVKSPMDLLTVKTKLLNGGSVSCLPSPVSPPVSHAAPYLCGTCLPLQFQRSGAHATHCAAPVWLALSGSPLCFVHLRR